MADVDRSKIVARRVLKSKYVLEQSGDKPKVLLPAFKEARPGGLSMDILWFYQTGLPKQRIALAEALNVSISEGHTVVGWASFAVKDVLPTLKHHVSRVAATPSTTNRQHADLIATATLCIGQDDDDAEDKAYILAKAVSEFWYQYGHYHSAPPSPSPRSVPPEVASDETLTKSD